MKQYEVTLTIPVYNVAPYVEKSLLSAFNQTFQSIEYLIVDDKGTDGSMDIVRRVISNHPRKDDIRIIDQGCNRKTGAARNAGLDNASGKYIFFMDSDDVIVPDCIDILYRTMQEHPVDFVAASYVRQDNAGKQYKGCIHEDIRIEGKYAIMDYRYGVGKEISVSMWNKLYLTSFLRDNNIRCIPSQIHEDAWFTYQVLLKAESCRLLSECTLYYTYNPSSSTGGFASNGYSENTARQFADIQKMKSEYIYPYAAEKFYRGALMDIMKMSLYHAYQVEISSQIDIQKKKRLENALLSPPFALPAAGNRNRISFKYLLYRFYYMLPPVLRQILLRAGGMMRIKSILRHWMHL